jgi:2'-5' RNA ligase
MGEGRGRCDDGAVRLFIALVPPAGAVEELVAATAELRAQAPGVRWVRPEQCHLTLAFLGEVRAGRAWAADELHMVRSHLGAGPGGTARHETVASWPLTGRGERTNGTSVR